jgi:hypothetical protein
MRRRSLLGIFANGWAVVLTSCGGFQSQWTQTGSLKQSWPQGRWVGGWLSATNGHKGQLRCLITAVEPQKLHCTYHAEWAKFLSGTFEITCEAIPQKDGSWRLLGSKDLGALFGGEFSHEGVLTKSGFSAKYRSALDKGTFSLKPAP